MNTTELVVQRSIIVDVPQADAFETFVNMTAWWPLATHMIGEAPGRALIVQTHAGGRLYGIDKNGDQQEIGTVLVYEPFDRLVLGWELGCEWKYDPSQRTEIDVRFVAESPARTRVDLVHRNFAVFGERADEMKAVYEADGAWTAIMACYEKVASVQAAGG
jgi:hypothetical protein